MYSLYSVYIMYSLYGAPRCVLTYCYDNIKYLTGITPPDIRCLRENGTRVGSQDVSKAQKQIVRHQILTMCSR